MTNQTSGAVFMIDFTNDHVIGQAIGGGVTAQREFISSDRSVVLVYDDSQHLLGHFDPAQEKDVFDYTIGGRTDSVIFSSDSKLAYVAVPTYAQQNSQGAVLVLNLASGGIKSIISSPAAKQLALSGNGTDLLVFSADSDQFSYIDLSKTTPTSVPVPLVATMSRPYTAFFSADNNTAYVLNCGNGCGGANPPSVQTVDMASLKSGIAANPQTPPTVGNPVAVGGANVGLLDGTTLYVAGNHLEGATQVAQLSSVNLSGTTATVNFTVNIGDGFHNLITKSKDNKIWVGAFTCQNIDHGCLSVVDVGSQNVILGQPNGPVTGFAEVQSRDLMYVCEGGELHDYDEKTVSWTMPLDIIGYAFDVKLLDAD